MTTENPLEALTSEQLHDLAVKRARHHLDAKFFWDLMRFLPSAEAAAGEMDLAETDVMRLSAHADDVADSGKGEVCDLMRPFYIEYLTKHGVTGP